MEPGIDDPRPDERPGIVDSLKSLVGTAVELVHTRVELVTTELQEEMHRIASVLLWGVIAVFFGGLFVLMVACTIIIAAGEEHRLTAALVMTGVFLAILVTALVILKSRLSAGSRLMGATRDELRADLDALRTSRHREP